MLDRWSRLSTVQLNSTTSAGRTTVLVEAALSGVRTLAPLGVTWAGAWRVLDGEMSLGALLGTSAAAAAALIPVAALSNSLQLMQSVGAHMERLADIMEADPEQAPSPRAPVPLHNTTGGHGSVELQGVGFRYTERTPWILRGVSFRAAPGQKIALVGRSGCGKSTMARVLIGLHPSTEGRVIHDGVPLEAMDLQTLRGGFGIVTQEPTLFTGTIRENIALGDPDA
jgi:ABC-type bacteriocin/lantibiotic exporter with double-glycine peptidase domain